MLEPIFGNRFHHTDESDTEAQSGFNTIFNTGFDVARQIQDVDLHKSDYDGHKSDFNAYARDLNNSDIHGHRSNFGGQKRNFEVNKEGFNRQMSDTDHEIHVHKNDFNVYKRDFFEDQKRDFDLSSFDPEVDAAGFVLNYSIFYSAFRDIIFGLEILVFYDVRGKSSYFAFFPQIHWQVHQNMTLQVGPGLVLSPIKIVPVFAHRVIFEEIIIT